jgi:hypothetical protein
MSDVTLEYNAEFSVEIFEFSNSIVLIILLKFEFVFAFTIDMVVLRLIVASDKLVLSVDKFCGLTVLLQ